MMIRNEDNSNSWWDYDIAWCADSIATCKKTQCYRHCANQPKLPHDEPFVCTWMCFMNTNECPFLEKGEQNDS